MSSTASTRLVKIISLIAACGLSFPVMAQRTSFLPDSAPATWREGQTGTNRCGTTSSASAKCQNLYINSLEDFCLWGPPAAGPQADIGHTEASRFCNSHFRSPLRSGYGTRLIPSGAITGAHFVQTPNYLQVTGIGNLSAINIPANDAGGELDPHGADGRGNPLGGAVFTNAFTGAIEQLDEWTVFISGEMFCFRACKPGPDAWRWCQHIYDVMGCQWNMPASYAVGYDSCLGDSGEPMGEYNGSTFLPGQPQTPQAHPQPSVSACSRRSDLGQAQTASVSAPTAVSRPTPGASSKAQITPAIMTVGKGSAIGASQTSIGSASAAALQSGRPVSSSQHASATSWERQFITGGLVAFITLAGVMANGL